MDSTFSFSYEALRATSERMKTSIFDKEESLKLLPAFLTIKLSKSLELIEQICRRIDDLLVDLPGELRMENISNVIEHIKSKHNLHC